MADILVHEKDGFAVLTLNREAQLNAMSSAMLRELKRLVRTRKERVLIITGAGRAFAAGADISELLHLKPPQAKTFSAFFDSVLDAIESSDAIVIAAINGFCLGGGNELAMACDLRVAAENATFSQPEVKLGIIPGAGGTQRLPLLVGIARAKDLIYTGKTIDARQAHHLGLVNRVAHPEELMQAAEGMAREILKNSESAVKAAKKAMRGPSLKKGLALETRLFSQLFAGGEPQGKIKAFLKK